MARNRITIGRSGASDIVIDEMWDTVSNDHADIELRDGQLTFFDHSTNGTIINGQKIHNMSVGIYPGDEIMLAGRYELKWEMINRYFPRQNRPTVTRNVRAEQPESDTGARNRQGASRATEHFSPQSSYASGNVSRRTVAEERYRDNFGKENIYSQAEIDRETEKWNWGAFFCTWLWAIFHKTYWPLIIILLAFIPYIGQVAALVLAVYLGMRGSKIAWSCGKYADFQSYKSAQKKWAIAGAVMFVLGLCVQAFSLFYVLMLF